MIQVPDFKEADVWTVQGTVYERYSAETELRPGDIELRLSHANRELTNCSPIYWERENGHFPDQEETKLTFI